MIHPAVGLAGERDLDSNSESIAVQRRIYICIERLLKRFETCKEDFPVREAVVESEAAHKGLIGCGEMAAGIARHCRVDLDGCLLSWLPLKVDNYIVIETIAAQTLGERGR